MCCSSGRRGSARRRWRRSWRASSASISARPRARSSPRPATSRRCSPISRSATSSSSTRSTGSTRRSRKSSIRRWRIIQLDLIIGEGPAARSVKIDLAQFTLVAATTRLGLLTNPLRDRFGIPVRLNFYSVEELEQIVRRGARILGLPLGDDGALEIARRARGTPRIAGRLLRRVRDFASVAGVDHVSRKIADKALLRLEVDALGLDQLDRRYLSMIARNFGGGPVGIETIAAGLSEPRDAIEDIIEPFLIQQGFIQRTPRGRLLTANAWRHLGLEAPKDLAQQQINLFQEED